MTDKMIWIGVFAAMSIIVLAFMNRESEYYNTRDNAKIILFNELE